ncbi:hypothetical protein [Streptomyces viridosporus]|uniref:hypothetical protein n=1 Tax=Streptomyces viridosporus TaxID=67581 RepID=UPI00332BF144
MTTLLPELWLPPQAGEGRAGGLGGFALLDREAVVWLVALLFAVMMVVCCFGLVGYGFGSVADGLAGRKERRPAVLRGTAALAGACALAVYTWGLLGIAGAWMEAEDGGTDSAPVRSCRTPGWLERSAAGVEITGYRVSVVPLGFVCETSDGGSYDNGDVPGYVNPAALGLALAAAVCAVSAGYASERGARAATGAGGSEGTGAGPATGGGPAPRPASPRPGEARPGDAGG